MKFILLFSLTLFNANAQDFELPEIYDVFRTGFQNLRLPIENKLSQLAQNFSIVKDPNGISFRTAKDIICPQGDKVLKDQAVARIQISNHVIDDTIVNHIFYFGCDGNQAFREEIVSTGPGARMFTVDDLFKERITADIYNMKELTFKEYGLYDQQNVEFFKWNKTIQDNIEVTSLYVEKSLIDRMTVTVESSSRKIAHYFKSSFNIKFNRNGYNFNAKRTVGMNSRDTVILDDINGTEILNASSRRISLKQFLEDFTLNGLAWIVESVLIQLPKTSFVALGNRNQKFIQELRDIQSWLLAGINMAVIQAKIEEYIDAAQKDLIVDRRP
jgi:hypothetical protein